MKIMTLRLDFKETVEASVWCDCQTIADVDAMIAWLHMAKANMKRWEQIRSRKAGKK